MNSFCGMSPEVNTVKAVEKCSLFSLAWKSAQVIMSAFTEELYHE
jgi:hypothetical protein